MSEEAAYKEKMPAPRSQASSFLNPAWLTLAVLIGVQALLVAVEFGELRSKIIDRTQDPYTATDAARDKVPVQIQIRALQAEQARLWAEFDKYPPPYLIEQVRSLTKRVHELESERDGLP